MSKFGDTVRACTQRGSPKSKTIAAVMNNVDIRGVERRERVQVKRRGGGHTQTDAFFRSQKGKKRMNHDLFQSKVSCGLWKKVGEMTWPSRRALNSPQVFLENVSHPLGFFRSFSFHSREQGTKPFNCLDLAMSDRQKNWGRGREKRSSSYKYLLTRLSNICSFLECNQFALLWRFQSWE